MPLNALSSSRLPYRKSKYSEGVSVHSDRLQREFLTLDMEPGIGEAPRKRPTRRAGPNHQGVHGPIVAAHLSVLLLVDANRNGNPLFWKDLTGKTHAMCAIGHRLVESGRSVLFTPAYRLVQDMLAAKRDLDLPRMLRKLDNIDFLLIDDLGYLPQGAEESEVLFTLIAERYERRSLGITSNLVFSQWEKVFANPMPTATAIDRIVHHSAILESDVPSYRTGAAQKRLQQEVYRQK